jgi:hypothetical protein
VLAGVPADQSVFGSSDGQMANCGAVRQAKTCEAIRVKLTKFDNA